MTTDAASPDGTRLSFSGGLSQIMRGLSLVLDTQAQTVLERRVALGDVVLRVIVSDTEGIEGPQATTVELLA